MATSSWGESPLSTPIPPSSPEMESSLYRTPPLHTPSPPSPPLSSFCHLPSLPSSPPLPPEIIIREETELKDHSFPRIGISDRHLNRTDLLLEITSLYEGLKIPHPAVVRRMISQPHLVPEEWKYMKSLSQSGNLHPVHLLSTADLEAFPEIVKVFFYWKMEKMDRENAQERVPVELEAILDPPVILPREREIVFLNLWTIRVESLSWMNCVKIIRTRKWERQIQLKARWVPGGVKENINQINISLEPKTFHLFDPDQNRERDLLAQKEEGVVDAPFPLPPTKPDMNILHWNARGIARANFLSNMRLLIQQHLPRMVVISETKVSRDNTPEIINKLPFEEYFLVEPVGLSGGFSFCGILRNFILNPSK